MTLIEKINNRTAKVGVIGLGYVGLPLVIEFCKKNFPVTGFDVDDAKVKLLNEGKSYIKHIDEEKIARIKDTFSPTTDFSLLSEMDCILICLPTPLNEYREPDISYVLNATEIITKHLRKEQLITLESTTYPGTTDEDMLAILNKSGLKAGEDYYLAYSPEREDPNNKDFSTSTIPKVVGGYSAKCLEAAKTLYDAIIVETVPVSSTKVAEATKLLENIYRSVNIALINELKMLFDRMGINVWEVINAAKTKPFGFQPFYPGPGLGGHCIPIDPFYLTWKAREYHFSTRFIELAGEINSNMPYYVIQRISDVLNSAKKSINGSKLLVLGLAYKKDIDDVRESPSIEIIQLLEERGAQVDYNDPYVPEAPKMRKHNLNKKSVPYDEKTLADYDCVVILTAHSVYDGDFIAKHARLIVDTRNVISDSAALGERLIKA